MDQRTDSELISAILNGHINEYRFIIGRYKHMAYATAYSILKNREDTEDAIQEAFTKAFRSLNTFKGNSKFSTWLFRIVYYTSLTKYQKLKPGKSDMGLEQSENTIARSVPNDGQHALYVKDRLKFLDDALKQMSPDDRLVLTLYYIEERSHHEIAELTGWKLSAIKVRMHRARIKMNSYLEELLSNEKKSLL